MNREIRRAFARVGYKVTELKRTSIGPVNDRGLRIGRWRELTKNEVELLRRGVSEEPRETLRGKPKKGRGAPKTKRPPRSFSSRAGLARVQTGERSSATGSVSPSKLKRARREVEARHPGVRPMGARPPGARPMSARPTGSRPPSARPPGSRPTGSRPTGGRPPRGGGERDARRDGPRRGGPR
jgi:hypothetical protein